MGKVLVYLVHGLGVESPEEWWGDTKETLKNSFENNKNCDIEFEYFNYKTKKFDFLKIIKHKLGIGETLAPLKDIGVSLASEIDNKKEHYDYFILFCHSMGGLVAANALDQIYKLNQFSGIRGKIAHIILCGTPLGGSDLAQRAKYIPGNTPHIKELLKDSNTRQVVSCRLRELTSIELYKKDTKPKLSFIKIINDQVVQSEEERFGVFINDIEKAFIEPIEGGHSDSIKNIKGKNKTKIIKHIKRCIESTGCEKINTDTYNELEEIFSSYANYQKLKKQHKDRVTKFLIDKIEKDFNEASEHDKNDMSKFIDLFFFYRKTFLSGSEDNDRKYILDIKRRIMVVIPDQEIEMYVSLKYPKETEFAQKKFINDLIRKLKESQNDPVDRFKEYSMKIRKRGDDNRLLEVHDIELNYVEDEKNCGVTIKINLGKFDANEELEIHMSFTAPTTIWMKNLSGEPDIIKLPRNIVETEIIIQEEIFSSSQNFLVPKIRKGKTFDVQEDKDTSLYYNTYKIKKLFTLSNYPSERIEIAVMVDHVAVS